MSLGTELDEAEQQYFTSGGESEIPAEPAAEVTPEPEVTAPVVEPEKVVETIAAEADKTTEKPEKTEQQKMVDIKALHEARAANRELRQKQAQNEAQLQDALKKLAAMEARLNPAQQAPAFEENPAEHLRTKVEELQREQSQTKEQQAEAHRVAQFRNWYQGQAQQYAQTQPDFTDAYNAYNKARVEELQNAGLTAQQANERLVQEEVTLATAAGQAGINPAQLVYQAAVLKGYKPVSRETQNPQVQTPNKLENVKRGMEASTPLSSIGGGGQTENLSWEWVASVPDDEFLAAFAKMEKAEARVRH